MKGEKKAHMYLRRLAQRNCPHNTKGKCSYGGGGLCEKESACWNWEAGQAVKLLDKALSDYRRLDARELLGRRDV